MGRQELQQIIAAGAKDEDWHQALFQECILRLVQDQQAEQCIEGLRPILDSGSDPQKAHARLLMAHSYRALGKRRMALFNYQAVARRESIDEATVLALAALVDIGDESSQRLAQNRIDTLKSKPENIAFLDLLDGGESLNAIRELLAE